MAGVFLALSRWAFFVAVIFFVLGSFAWWGNPKSILRPLMGWGVWSLGVWLVALVLQRVCLRWGRVN